MMGFLPSPLISIQFLQYQIAGHTLLSPTPSLFLTGASVGNVINSFIH